jgi:ADP-ribose pyrophosphatase YjhB (NUDIX family)
MNDQIPKWLNWTREIYSLAKAGLAYTKNEFDLERYRHLLEINAEMIASQSSLQKETILESFSMQAGYATPKIDVRGAVVRDGRILLVQEKSDCKWVMPGGWADIGDTPSTMVEREVWEESGLKVKAEKVIAVYDANRFQPLEFYHSYKIIFLCKYLSGETRPSIETLDADFFNPDILPPLSLSRTNGRMLEEVLAHIEYPRRLTAFD